MFQSVLCCVLLVLGLSSCGGGGGVERDASRVVVALQSDATTLDPHSAADAGSMRMIENLYSTLFRYTENYGEVEPDVVREMERSEEGTVYTFFLREDVRFHSGRRMTAEDVKWSLERIREEGIRAQQFEAVESMEVVDAHTLRVTLSEPYTPFLTALAHPMNAILDREAVEAAGDRFDQAAAGSGPFRLAEWRRGQRIRLEAFEDYFLEGLPKLREIEFRPVPDATSANTALRNGEIDVILDLNPREINRLASAAGITVRSVPGTFWEYIGLNTQVAPLEDVRVRQAIAHAVDREALARMIKFGHAEPIRGGHIPETHPAHWLEAVYPERDVEKARALLAEAGITETLELSCLVGSDFDYQVNAAQVIKQQLLDIDIDVTVESLESGVFFSRLGAHDFEMTVVGWLGFVDADEWTYDLFHSEGAYNQQGFSHAEVDRLLEGGRREADEARRMALYREAQEIIAREAPMVFLYWNDRAAAYAEGLKGFDVHPTLTTLSLRAAYWTE